MDTEKRDMTWANMGLSPKREIEMLRDSVKRMYSGEDRLAAFNRIHDLEKEIENV